jgi:integrase
MKVAALSGARLDAIYKAKVEGNVFVFPAQKKETKARRIPIHSMLVSLVARGRWKEFTSSMAASKQFRAYRRKLGIGEDGSGRRRAVVNFHSFRRWFTSAAERAGQLENVIAAVVGHKRPGLTFGRYSSGPSMEQMRACVEAVRLPPPS